MDRESKRNCDLKWEGGSLCDHKIYIYIYSFSLILLLKYLNQQYYKGYDKTRWFAPLWGAQPPLYHPRFRFLCVNRDVTCKFLSTLSAQECMGGHYLMLKEAPSYHPPISRREQDKGHLVTRVLHYDQSLIFSSWWAIPVEQLGIPSLCIHHTLIPIAPRQWHIAQGSLPRGSRIWPLIENPLRH